MSPSCLATIRNRTEIKILMWILNGGPVYQTIDNLSEPVYKKKFRYGCIITFGCPTTQKLVKKGFVKNLSRILYLCNGISCASLLCFLDLKIRIVIKGKINYNYEYFRWKKLFHSPKDSVNLLSYFAKSVKCKKSNKWKTKFFSLHFKGKCQSR